MKAIGITGYSVEDIAGNLRENGFLDIVLKPFDMEVLVNAVSQAFREMMKELSMNWQGQINDDVISWLLEHDSPGVRYLAFRDLLKKEESDPELSSAKVVAHAHEPIATVLAK